MHPRREGPELIFFDIAPILESQLQRTYSSLVPRFCECHHRAFARGPREVCESVSVRETGARKHVTAKIFGSSHPRRGLARGLKDTLVMLTRLGRETILVVEDDDEVREVAVWMLTEPGPSNRNHRHEVVLFLPTP